MLTQIHIYFSPQELAGVPHKMLPTKDNSKSSPIPELIETSLEDLEGLPPSPPLLSTQPQKLSSTACKDDSLLAAHKSSGTLQLKATCVHSSDEKLLSALETSEDSNAGNAVIIIMHTSWLGSS